MSILYDYTAEAIPPPRVEPDHKPYQISLSTLKWLVTLNKERP